MNKHLYLCHLLVLSSPTLMMHGHTNLKNIKYTVWHKYPLSNYYWKVFYIIFHSYTWKLVDMGFKEFYVHVTVHRSKFLPLEHTVVCETLWAIDALLLILALSVDGITCLILFESWRNDLSNGVSYRLYQFLGYKSILKTLFA